MPFEYSLEHIITHLRQDGIDGVQPIITDYDWGDDVFGENVAKVTVWLKRYPEENND